MKYKTIIVDDEINNIELINLFIEKFCPELLVIDKVQNIDGIITSVENQVPEIIFLDIKLNDRNSFEIVDYLLMKDVKIIFMTAYSEFALKAFKANAIDYLLKPIEINELITAVNKAILLIKENKKLDKITKVIQSSNLGQADNDHINILFDDKMVLLKISDIIYLESKNKQVYIYCTNNEIVISSKNIAYFENIFSKRIFFRNHQSTLINVNHVINVNKRDGFYCEMIQNINLPVAKRKQNDLLKFLNVKK